MFHMDKKKRNTVEMRRKNVFPGQPRGRTWDSYVRRTPYDSRGGLLRMKTRGLQLRRATKQTLYSSKWRLIRQREAAGLMRVPAGRLSERDGNASLMVPISPIKFVHSFTSPPSWSQSVQPARQNFHLYCII